MDCLLPEICSVRINKLSLFFSTCICMESLKNYNFFLPKFILNPRNNSLTFKHLFVFVQSSGQKESHQVHH